MDEPATAYPVVRGVQYLSGELPLGTMVAQRHMSQAQAAREELALDENVTLLTMIEAGVPISDEIVASIRAGFDGVKVHEACVVASQVDVLAITEGTIRDLGGVVLSLVSTPILPASQHSVARSPPAPPVAVHRYFLRRRPLPWAPPAEDAAPAEAYVDLRVQPSEKEMFHFHLEACAPDFLVDAWEILNRDRFLLRIRARDAAAINDIVLTKLQRDIPETLASRTYHVMRRPTQKSLPSEPPAREIEALLLLQSGAQEAHAAHEHITGLFSDPGPPDRPDPILACGDGVDVFAWVRGSPDLVGARLLRVMKEPMPPRGRPPYAVRIYITEAGENVPADDPLALEVFMFINTPSGLPKAVSENKQLLLQVLLSGELTSGHNAKLHGARAVAHRPQVFAHLSFSSPGAIRDFLMDLQRISPTSGPLVRETVTHLLLPARKRIIGARRAFLVRLLRSTMAREDAQTFIDQEEGKRETKQRLIGKMRNEGLINEKDGRVELTAKGLARARRLAADS